MKKLVLILSLAFSINAFSQVPSYVPTSGLVGWWPFNGNAIDESINTNDGTVNGATLTADRFSNINSAYNFDGNTSYISILNTPQISNTNKFSYSTWIDYSGVLNPWPMHQVLFLNSENGSSTGAGFILRILSNDTIQFEIGDGIISPTAKIRYPATNIHNQWAHIVCTYDSLSMKFYINGGLVGTNLFPLNLKNTLNNYSIGKYNTLPSNPQFYNGKIDDIGFWNRALTACEINALYQSGTSSMTVNASSSTICSGGSTTLTASGATSYTWMPGSLSGNSAVVTPGTTTTYTITGTDGSGCTSTTTSLVNVNIPPSTTPAQTNASCNGLSNGSATIAASGGTPGYTYSWSPSGGTGATASALSAGSYTCSVTDANSCTAEQSFVITQPNALMAMSSSTAILCNGGSSTVTVNAMDGTAPYTGT